MPAHLPGLQRFVALCLTASVFVFIGAIIARIAP